MPIEVNTSQTSPNRLGGYGKQDRRVPFSREGKSEEKFGGLFVERMALVSWVVFFFGRGTGRFCLNEGEGGDEEM